ncbi:MAG TPA: UPF0182 family protein [Terriglobales bacterium]|nr:UPF0182 family protein [Terriglobales bacterium]
MINLLVIAAIVLVFAHVRWTQRRRGYPDPTILVRDIGLAAAGLYVVIEGSRFAVDYAWWRQLGQLATFWQYLRIRWLPQTAGALLGIALFVTAFRWARHRVQSQVSRTRLFGLAGHAAAIVLGVILAWGLLDPWTIVLYLGSEPASGYRDPIFGHGLAFYMFRLPFYEMVFGWLAALAILALVLFAGATAIAGSAGRVQEWRERLMAQAAGGYSTRPVVVHRLADQEPGSLDGVIRCGAIVLLVIFAVAQWFARYSILYSSHDFLYGADFVDRTWGLPFYWAQIAAALALAVAIATEPLWNTLGKLHGDQWRGLHTRRVSEKVVAGAVAAVFLVMLILPSVVEATVRQIYVHPNELTLERPYIADHIRATWMAYDIAQTSHEEPFTPRAASTLDLSQYANTADNIRIWDWQQFHDNITQLQALRPYYTFPDTDFDRYPIGGQVRQTMISARELDTGLLPPQAQTWVNLNFQYTHGYGAVAALVNAANEEGQPELFLKDAPPTSSLPEFQLKQPRIYFGEQTDRPVFVDTLQQEFDYPKGDENTYTTYAGSAGISVGSFLWRFAAAVDRNDWNILLTQYLTSGSRLLLHRQIVARVQRLAPFLMLDSDPYLVVNRQGDLYWMLDAYTQSDLHPFSEPVDLGDRELNYIRNSVKITINAYNGAVRFYVFDPQDPVLAAYRHVFPELFRPRSAMPADLLQHIRYPETIFNIQAQIYRVYHMQDPRVFYNKEDKWDIAKQIVSQEQTSPTNPYYVMLQLPGEQKAEFVLMLPFTPSNRDNLIAWIAARCDPAHYGQIIFYRLPKDQLVYGPLQIESRVDQNRDISKDLSLWNQQGSRVIRANTLVLPVDGTFLYVEPIYIQATQAHLPELKKLVLAIGDRLIYSDTLPQAIAALAQPAAGESANAGGAAAPAPGAAPTAAPTTANAALPATPADRVPAAVLRAIQGHMERYRQLTAQGQLAAAGRELQAIDEELQRALHARPH